MLQHQYSADVTDLNSILRRPRIRGYSTPSHHESRVLVLQMTLLYYFIRVHIPLLVLLSVLTTVFKTKEVLVLRY